MKAALDLDFARKRPAWPPWLALVVGIALAADTGLQYAEARDGIAQIEQRNSAQAGRAPVEEAVPEQTKRELEAARRVLQELSLPWEALFRSIEAAVSPDTALLSIEPDAGRRAVQIVGEARSYAAILKFMDRLETASALAGVHLLHHEMRAEAAERPYLFTLAATWKAVP